jgi:hypothetical protein
VIERDMLRSGGRAMTPDQYLGQLREIGWFDGLPPQAAMDVEANVRRTINAGVDPEPWPEPIWFDCESIGEPGDYKSLLSLFSRCSYGAFEPSNVREQWEDDTDEQVVHLAFELGGRKFERTLRGEDSWVSPDFFDLLDEAMETSGSGLVFSDIDTGDQTAMFFLCNGEAYDRAEAAGLLPELVSGRDELDEAEE